jgi:Spy/CpxP family protein refolding chaperone
MFRKASLLLLTLGTASAVALSQGGQGPGTMGQGMGRGMGQGMGRGMGQGMVWHRADMAKKLNLSDQQQKEMQNLRIELQKKNIPLESKIRLARLEIQHLMLADKPDKAAIETQMRSVSDLELQVKLNGLDHQFAVRALLTPEQLKIWQENRGNGPMGNRRIRIYRFRGPMGSMDDPNGQEEVQQEVEVN